jgi:murein DD-endopeptidase MepM/ murein hydrolase activator NlpD
MANNTLGNRGEGTALERARSFAQDAAQRAIQSIQQTRLMLDAEDGRWRLLLLAGRFTTHSAIVCVLIIALMLAGLRLGLSDSAEASVNGVAARPANGANVAQKRLQSPPVILSAVQAGLQGSGGSRLLSPAGPFAGPSQQAAPSAQDVSLITRNVVLEAPQKAEVRTGIITYTVQPGDTVEAIAQRFGLLPTTIVWSNTDVEDNPDVLRIGQVLNVLPVNGIWYTVQSDDTISGIAQKYKAKFEDIIASPLNNLNAGSNLLPGQRIVVPGGVKPFVPRVVEVQQAPGRSFSGPAPRFQAGGNFGWPTNGYVSQGYWWGHRGIDIAGGFGVPVAAADGGYVSYAGWSAVGYGYMVLIDHGNGYSTLYGHLNAWYVDPGQAVARGQIIGAMGSTGNSTGPHLHFEIRYGGVSQNPLVYLP